MLKQKEVEKKAVAETIYADIRSREISAQQLEESNRQKIRIVIELIWAEFDVSGDGRLNCQETEMFIHKFAEKYNIQGIFKQKQYE